MLMNNINICDIDSNERPNLIYLNGPIILNALCSMHSPNLKVLFNFFYVAIYKLQLDQIIYTMLEGYRKKS